jgi:glycogen(starch) synthase
MHVLITSDTVGGVWTYTQELVTGLVQAGHRVTLVSFGKMPRPHQTAWMHSLDGLDYRPTEYRLEWMEVAERDIEESRRYLELLVAETKPDLLHFNQYCYGDLPLDVPRIVVAHSDVVSWWTAVYGGEPDDSPWIRRYRGHVIRGLGAADLVVAPSKWMLDEIEQHYIRPQHATVIHNGRTAAMFEPSDRKDDFTLTVGRLWDAGKQVSLLLDSGMPGRVSIVGWEREPGKELSKGKIAERSNVELLGAKSQDELRALFARASIYAAPSRYEPFGLAPLEAALSRCALVMNDNPVFHELWGDAALYFKSNDSADLARAIEYLRDNPRARSEFAERCYQRACERFTAERMVEQYEDAYQGLCSRAEVA